MKCPYNNFEDCLVEKCPACIYEVEENRRFETPPGYHGSEERAIREHMGLYITDTTYIFKGCKLVESGTQPAPKSETKIENNITSRAVAVSSLF